MDTMLIVILLILLLGGGRGVFWRMGVGWGVGSIGLIVLDIARAFLLNGQPGRLR